MAEPFADRRDKLFGRDRDVEHLAGRVRFKGLTAVVARPAMGKSWLLTELARTLSEDHEPPHLVGFARSYGQTPDLLLRAVVDLYERWLSDAGYLEQAKMVWDQQKGSLLPNVAKTIGSLIKEVDLLAKPVTALVSEAINGLVAADETLRTGGLKLPTLQYDQARDLVAAVNQMSERPVVIVLDQWEQSPDPALEAKTLNAFLHQLEEWPPVHVFMALRPEQPAIEIVDRLVASRHGPAEQYVLGSMDLEDTAEQQRMIAYVQGQVPAAAEADEKMLLDHIDGYPGVVYKWTEDYWRATMTSAADLASVAADAQQYRFIELDDLLKPLQKDRRRLAIRLALLPVIADAKAWGMISAYILDGLGEPLLDDLKLDKVLESREPPSFGHAKRAEAIRRWLIDNRSGDTRIEATSIVRLLAAPIRDLDSPEAVLNSVILWGLVPTSREIGLDDLSRALCQAAATLFKDFSAGEETLLDGAREAIADRSFPAAPLLAMGLLNTLNHAKEENALERRDGLLEALRKLAADWPDDAAVREELAKGLFNTLIDTESDERKERLWAELLELAEAHPEDAWTESLRAAMEAPESTDPPAPDGA